MIKRTCLALLASSMIATPALARDKTLYLGIEGGLLWAKDVDLDLKDPQSTDRDVEDFLEHRSQDGLRCRRRSSAMTAAWSAPSWSLATSGPRTTNMSSIDTGDGIITDTIDADGRTRYLSIMTNLLLDVGNEDGLSFYAGPGIGFAWGKFNIDNCDDGQRRASRMAASPAGHCRRSLCRFTPTSMSA